MGEELVFRFTIRGYATVVLDNIGDFTYKSEIAPLIKTKAIIVRVLWYCSWFNHELLTHEQSKTQKIADIIKVLFDVARKGMTTNQIADLEMVDYLCKPIIEVIESNFLSCSEFHHPFFFSSKIIQDILSLSPSCLQNEDAHIANSFKVVCLRDTACEKLHLKNTLNVTVKSATVLPHQALSCNNRDKTKVYDCIPLYSIGFDRTRIAWEWYCVIAWEWYCVKWDQSYQGKQQSRRVVTSGRGVPQQRIECAKLVRAKRHCR